MKKIGKVIIAVVIVAVIGAAVTARLMKPKEEMQMKELPAVTLATAATGTIERETALMGKIQPSDTYHVMPKTSGEIIEIYVQNGDQVKQGDPIARIDNQKAIDSAKATYDSASASLRAAQDQANTATDALNRMTPLYQAGDVAPQTYTQTLNSANAAQSQAAAARAQLNSAKLQYDTQVEYSTVTAPSDGTVQNQNMTLNGTVSQSSELCVITGSGQRKVKFNVTEDILNNLSLGQKVTVEKNSTTYEGTISDLSRLIDSSTGLFAVEAELKNADALADGVAAKVELISATAKDAMIIPSDYVYYSSGNPYVYVYENGIAKRVFITLGITNDSEYQVIDGITKEDKIVSSWTNDIYDGASVRIIDENGNIAAN
ncbi:efflux RND transporter periplasmic adaptor subunit [Oribacterium sp. WCC10]|uniref:efflux RND transporter periplasmic adaptor subunit n=1 Tax=Oribacterium sp. WCC10 TaxID=1855343 RepID=UPI0008EDB7B1|nr:efflux RND transporter periplasmic adaptor subunit [Oribacterium sp. WCC10]SFG34816.1 RND family efflux transporter, MFP subunit [Oribacterium sp. WCC10]